VGKEGSLDIYARYAEVYDRVGQPRFSLGMADFTLDLLERSGRGPQRILDLACGTGEAALRFARAGHQVIGVDSSGAMLEQARRKAAAAGLPVVFLHQDMRSFHVETPADLVTCFYDSLNYLLHPAELQEVFVRAATVLAPGGLLVCDLNTTAGLARDYNGQVYLAMDEEDLLGIHRATHDEKTRLSRVHLTFFVRRGEIWERFDEVHTQRAYDRAEVEAMLDQAGLQLFELFDRAFDEPGPEATRVIYVAFKEERPAWPERPAGPIPPSGGSHGIR